MKTIILLHGALGSSKTLQPLANQLSKNFNVHTFDFIGHGENSNSDSFSMNQMSDQLSAYILSNNLDKPAIFGFSMGGYVALNALTKTPDLLSKVMTLGTKFNWTPEFSNLEVKNLNPDKIEEKVPQFGKYLDSLHGEHWKSVMHQTANVMIDLGNQPLLTSANLSTIQTEIIVVRGEKDHMTEESESMNTANTLPNGSYYPLENQPHMIEKVDIEKLSEIILTHI